MMLDIRLSCHLLLLPLSVEKGFNLRRREVSHLFPAGYFVERSFVFLFFASALKLSHPTRLLTDKNPHLPKKKKT